MQSAREGGESRAERSFTRSWSGSLGEHFAVLRTVPGKRDGHIMTAAVTTWRMSSAGRLHRAREFPIRIWSGTVAVVAVFWLTVLLRAPDVRRCGARGWR